MNSYPLYETDSKRWHAVVGRELSADGHFYYAVRTTGIFCRPSCASRTPNRENVEFFNCIQDALASGYRPCKKCQPTGITNKERAEQIIIRACRIMENSDHIPALVALADAVGLSPYYFHRLFKQITGVTPKQYATTIRARRLHTCLQSSGSVTAALYEAGYSSSSSVYSDNRDHLSMKPKEYRSGGAGVTIYYGIAECSLGWLIVAATDRGVCGIEFGDDPSSLPGQLKERFPRANILVAGADFVCLLENVVRCINAPRRTMLNIPLDIQGTAFQQQVWTMLRQIKPGKTMSYTEVAEKLGKPDAARAVASACAANKLAVVIPCHRVITKDGKLSGYRWGVERKRALLKNEKEGE